MFLYQRKFVISKCAKTFDSLFEQTHKRKFMGFIKNAEINIFNEKIIDVHGMLASGRTGFSFLTLPHSG